jgi:hypothetical protein
MVAIVTNAKAGVVFMIASPGAARHVEGRQMVRRERSNGYKESDAALSPQSGTEGQK